MTEALKIDNRCRECGEEKDPEEIIRDLIHPTCIDCHDAEGFSMNECGCERCLDKACAAADRAYDEAVGK